MTLGLDLNERLSCRLVVSSWKFSLSLRYDGLAALDWSSFVAVGMMFSAFLYIIIVIKDKNI